MTTPPAALRNDPRDIASQLSDTAHNLHHRFAGLNNQLSSLTAILSNMSTPTHTPQHSNQQTHPPRHQTSPQIPNMNSHSSQSQRDLGKYMEDGEDQNDDLVLEGLDLQKLSQSIEKNPTLFDPLKAHKPVLGSDGRLIKIDESVEHSVAQLKKDVELLLSTIQIKTANPGHVNRDILHDLLHMMAIMYTVDDQTYIKHYYPLCRYFHDFLFHPNSTRHLLFNQQNTNNTTQTNHTNKNNPKNNQNIDNNQNDFNPAQSNRNQQSSNDGEQSPSFFDIPKKPPTSSNPAQKTPKNHHASSTPSNPHHGGTKNGQNGYFFNSQQSTPKSTPAVTPTHSTGPKGQSADDSNLGKRQQGLYGGYGHINPVVKSNRRTQQGDSEMEAMFDGESGGIAHLKKGKKNNNNKNNKNNKNVQNNADDKSTHSKYDSDTDDDFTDDDDEEGQRTETMFSEIERGTFPIPRPKPFIPDPKLRDSFLQRTIIDKRIPDVDDMDEFDFENEKKNNKNNKNNKNDLNSSFSNQINKSKPTPKTGYVMELVPSVRHRVEHMNDDNFENIVISSTGNILTKSPSQVRYADNIDSLSDTDDDNKDNDNGDDDDGDDDDGDDDDVVIQQPQAAKYPQNEPKPDASPHKDDSATPHTIGTPAHNVPKGVEFVNGRWVRSAMFVDDESDDPFSSGDETALDDIADFGTPEYESLFKKPIREHDDDDDGEDGEFFSNFRGGNGANFNSHFNGHDKTNHVLSGDETDDEYDPNDVNDGTPQSPGLQKQGRSRQNSINNEKNTKNAQQPPQQQRRVTLDRDELLRIQQRKARHHLPTLDKQKLRSLIDEEERLRESQYIGAVPGLGNGNGNGDETNQNLSPQFTSSSPQIEQLRHGTIIGDPVVRRQSVSGHMLEKDNGEGSDKNGTNHQDGSTPTNPPKLSLNPITPISISTAPSVQSTNPLSVTSPAPAIIRAMTHVIQDRQNHSNGQDTLVDDELEGLSIDAINQPVLRTDLPGADVLDSLSLNSNALSSQSSKGSLNGNNNPTNKKDLAQINKNWQDNNNYDIGNELDGLDDDDEPVVKSTDGKLLKKNTANDQNSSFHNQTLSSQSSTSTSSSSFKLMQFTPEEVETMLEASKNGKKDYNNMLSIAANGPVSPLTQRDLTHSSVGKLNIGPGEDGDDSDPFAGFDDDDDDDEFVVKKNGKNGKNDTKNDTKKISPTDQKSPLPHTPSPSLSTTSVNSSNNKTSGLQPFVTNLDSHNNNNNNKNNNPEKVPDKLTRHTASSRDRSSSRGPNARKPVAAPVNIDLGDFDDDDEENDKAILALKESRKKKRRRNKRPKKCIK